MPKRKIDLDGKTWIKYSLSVWDIIKTPAETRMKHPAMFPVKLVTRLLRIFSHPGDVVLDVFAGTGSTILGAVELDRVGVGFEINERFIEDFHERLQALDSPLEAPVTADDYQMHHADSRALEEFLDPESVDFCLSSPPYWDILRQKRTADKKAERPYSESARDLGNIVDYEAFLDELEQVYAGVYRVLKTGKYCVVIVMDLRKKATFFPLHVDVIERLRRVGFTLDDIIIWDRHREYNNLRPLGYPYVFRVNKIHEFLLIFQKRAPRGK